MHLLIMLKQCIRKEGKKICILYELENKTQVGVCVHCEPHSGFSGGPGSKALEKLSIWVGNSMI